MTAERRNQIVLGLLAVVLLGALYQAFGPSGSVAPAGAAAGAQRPGSADGAGAPSMVATPDVRLESLDEGRVSPAGGDRNLFRFGARQAAVRRPREERLPPPDRPSPPPGPTVPATPPIALKFIGVVQATSQAQTYAVLRDDRGVYHGREGDIIEGRYRILRIGTESIELAYVNGTGRQTIRLGS